ncbi:MAG: ATP-binding protein [Bacteroidales bacterium]|nr:ATP-binding protein [Bacteroidales bacterium]
MMTYKIAIASGKGGTGKTTVSLNLFYTLQKQLDQKIQLVDCDVEEPNINLFTKGELHSVSDVNIKIPVIDSDKCVYCGDCASACAYNAILFVKSISHIAVLEDLCHGCGACTYVCNQPDVIVEKDKKLGEVNVYSLENGNELVEGKIEIGSAIAVPVIGKTLKSTDENALRIIDAPPGTSCPVMETIKDVDYTILVTEPTPFGLNDLKLMVETMRKMKGKFGVVINRAGLGNLAIYDYLKEEKIELLMEIPFDKNLARIYSEGKIMVDEVPAIYEKYVKLFDKVKLNLDEANSYS